MGFNLTHTFNIVRDHVNMVKQSNFKVDFLTLKKLRNITFEFRLTVPAFKVEVNFEVMHEGRRTDQLFV